MTWAAEWARAVLRSRRARRPLGLAAAALLCLGQVTVARPAAAAQGGEVCTGPGAGGSVLPGQTDTCQVRPDTAMAPAPAAGWNRLQLLVDSPQGATVTSCQPVTTATYATAAASTAAATCTITVTSGSVAAGDLIGTVAIAIPAGTPPGTPLAFEPQYCTVDAPTGTSTGCVAAASATSGPGARVASASAPTLAPSTAGGTRGAAAAATGVPVPSVGAGPVPAPPAAAPLVALGLALLAAATAALARRPSLRRSR